MGLIPIPQNECETSQNMEFAEDGRISPSGNLNISRERSNSDPGRRERTIVMNGGNTVPTRRAPTPLNATEVGSPTHVSGANSSPGTPPPVRRSKLAVSIGRLFRPWKWRRRKKSQKFITTSQSKEPSFYFCFVMTLWQKLIRYEVCFAETRNRENDNSAFLFNRNWFTCFILDYFLWNNTKELSFREVKYQWKHSYLSFRSPSFVTSRFVFSASNFFHAGIDLSKYLCLSYIATLSTGS